MNYFKFAWRRLMFDKRTSFINLFGLTVGLVGFLLIVQYVWYEKSYDQFHTNKERIYRVGLEVYRDNKLNIRSAINYPGVGTALKADIPEVDKFLRMVREESMVQIGTERFREDQLFFADSSFFQIFSVPLVQGDAATVLKEPNSIVISSSIAQKYFGTSDCIGKTVNCNNHFINRDFIVTGVFKDLPQNTHLLANILVSFSTYNSNRPGFIQPFQWRDFYNYVLLRENADASSFIKKITATDFVNDHDKSFAQRNMKHALIPQQLTGIYLNSNLAHEINVSGNGSMLTFLLLIAFFVLGMAWINYINLSTAMAIKRVKEIGIRKTIGAIKKNLVGQFLTEAFLLNGIALLLALALLFLIKPSFNTLTGKNIGIPVTVWAGLFIFLLIAVVGSVWYPATLLSGFPPLKALKNEKLSSAKGGWLRKSLIIFQFSLSAVLIICTAVVLLQLKHMQKAPLGLNIDQTIVVRSPLPNDSASYNNYLVFKQSLSGNPLIKSVVASHVVPGDESEWTPGIRKIEEGSTMPGQSLTCSANAIEPGFIKQFDIPVKYGRDLSKDFGTDNYSILLTETAAAKLNFAKPEDALNRRLLIVGDTFTVVGITGDFRHYSVKHTPQPYVFFQRADEYRKYSVKVSGNDVAAAVAFIQKTYAEIFPQSNFEYVFADDLFAKQYDAEKKTGIIVSIFTIVAIIIACLGLLGLTIFITQQRIKEVGIRKVLGASVAGITTLLSKDFLKLVIVSSVIAFPLAWWAMNKWLEDFAYRITISWWLFAVTGVAIFLIAFLTVSVQTIKAALSNPVKSLRTE
jgi:putative ABC transport system permease protein